ncbi:MAG: phosphopyruvate hydratase [Burkholderiales bacterium]
MTPSTITRVHARRVFDSRGRPTVEAEIRLASGVVGRGIAPSGASRGTREAVDLRDGGTRLGGHDVAQAIANVRGPIARAIFGMDALEQADIDGKIIELDGTPNFGKLGGNAAVAVSIAVAQAGALAFDMPLWQYFADDGPVSLPMPEVQIFGGGAHAGRRIDIQDLMVMPVGAWTFDDAITMVAEVYRAAGVLMQEAGRLAGVADEGGWWPQFASNEEALEMTVRAIERAGCHPGSDAAISLDIAASEFGREGRYKLALDERELDSDGMSEMLLDWIERYPIVSIEDPLAEDDPEAWIAFTRAAKHRVQVIGDDLLVTNAARIEEAAASGWCNAVLVKVNQAGTLTQARAALDAAKAAGFGTIVSARSGESEDSTIAHLAVGWDAGQLKVGSFARSERLAKWNEVLRIEDAMGGDARFAGIGALPPRK